MELFVQAKKLGQSLLDLIFPISCLICGEDGSYLCDKCRTELPRLANQQCLVCQTPSPFGKTHVACKTKNTIDGSISALPYKDRNVHKIIETFKYNFVSDLSAPLASLLIDEIEKQGLKNYFQEFILIPTPLHQRRFNWRGFNQAHLLAEALSKKLEINIDNQLIQRTKFTQPQIKLNADERKRNMANAFELTKDATNKKLLVVDDVVTSGSTANELAKLLKRGHASEIWIVSVAHG